MLAARRHHYVELARPESESESALSVEPAPSVERRHRHDAELGRRRRPRHAVFDDGPHGGDLLLVCVPGLLPSMVSSTSLPNARYICCHFLTAASGTDSLLRPPRALSHPRKAQPPASLSRYRASP